MKTAAVVALAVACVLAMTATTVFGQGFYNPYAPQPSSGGLGGGLLALLGLLVLLPLLFNNNNSGSGSTTLIYGNFSSPATGK